MFSRRLKTELRTPADHIREVNKMTYEGCDVHPGESATNGCRLCRCPDCGKPQEHHGPHQCLLEQVKIYKKLYRLIEDNSRAITPIMKKAVGVRLPYSEQKYSEVIQRFCELVLEELVITAVENPLPSEPTE